MKMPKKKGENKKRECDLRRWELRQNVRPAQVNDQINSARLFSSEKDQAPRAPG